MARKDKDRKSTAREIRNRQAFFQYEVLEKVEAGLVLIGSEVKSIRDGNVSFADSYVRVDDGEAFLLSCHIAEYKNAKAFGHEPLRRRKLLLHRRELRKLEKKVETRGVTLIPLRIYFNARGIAKVEVGICRGKQLHDKRRTARERESEREIRREMSKYR